MDENEIFEKRKAGKFVIKGSCIKVKGNPFVTPFPSTERISVFAVLDEFRKRDLPPLKKFAAARLRCKVGKVEIEILEPIK